MSDPAVDPLVAPTITATVDPGRMGVRLTVTVPAGTTSLAVWRVSTATGHAAYVRGWEAGALSGSQTTVLLFDWEAPLGVALVYYAQTLAPLPVSAVGSTAPLTLTDTRDWLVDLARPTNTFPITVEALPELQFDGPTGVHRVLDRRDPILTQAPLWTPSGALSIVTATRSERDRARTILGGGVAFLLRTPPAEGVGNMYLGVTGLREQRLSRLALHDDRRFVADVVQVARPDPTVFVPEPPLTYSERLATWPKYRDATATGKSYQELAYTFPADRIDPIPPWLPDDV